MATGRAGVGERWQRAGDLVMNSVPSSPQRLRAVGSLGVALVAGLAGVSLLLGDLSGTDVDTAGTILLAVGAVALAAAVRGFSTKPTPESIM